MAADQISQNSLNQSFSGYYRAFIPRQPDLELVESDPGTKAGEYLR